VVKFTAMPFKSEAQRKFLYATNPKLASEFEKKTPKGLKLPKKAAK
jgi:hypothetical protein